jgi:hypothetical protein
VAHWKELSDLPAVHAVLQRILPAVERYPRGLVVTEVRLALESLRDEIRAGRAAHVDIEQRAVEALAQW